jgi:ABC-2 type transport system permease protein
LQHGVRTFLDQSGLLEGAPPEAFEAVQAQTIGSIMTQMQRLGTDPPVGVSEENLKEDQPKEEFNFFNLFMPAFAVMFSFFLTGHIGQSFHKERDAGTFRRLLASPLSRFSLVLGPTIAYTVVVILQVLFLFGVSVLLFGMELGDSPLGLLAVTIALGLVAASLGLLLGAVTRTGNQADTTGSLIAFVVPFIGGIFAFGSYTPGYRTEGFIATIAPFFPHMHAAEGYRLIMENVGTAGDVLAQVGYLLIFAVIFFAVARWRLRFN